MAAGGESRPAYHGPVPGRISTADVAHVARLARLELSEADLEQFTDQLGAVLEHARDVEALETARVPPTAHPLPLRNVLRPDVIVPCLDREEVLAQAPDTEAGQFRVPRILGEAP
jgi:aspartyl-tRNA(Asn)/glutamyl-tRNA(Gln) amidotransferase subunit C